MLVCDEECGRKAVYQGVVLTVMTVLPNEDASDEAPGRPFELRTEPRDFCRQCARAKKILLQERTDEIAQIVEQVTGPVMRVDGQALNFGVDGTMMEFCILNYGTHPLEWEAVSGHVKITLQKQYETDEETQTEEGAIEIGDLQWLVVTLERDGIPPGQYTEEVTVRDKSAQNDDITVQLMLEVTE